MKGTIDFLDTNTSEWRIVAHVYEDAENLSLIHI